MGTRRAAEAPRFGALLLALLLAAQLAAQSGFRASEAYRLYARGDYEGARRESLAAYQADPLDMDAASLLALSLIALGRPADAELYASRAWTARKDPRLAEALGEANYLLGRNEAALAFFMTYVANVAEGGRVGQAYYHIGEIYLRLGRFGHADIALTTALRFEPGKPAWWSRLGWAREKAADFANAVRAYEEALRLDPRLEEALLGRDRAKARVR